MQTHRFLSMMFCLFMAGCVTLPVDGPYGRSDGPLKLKSPDPIRTISVICHNTGEKALDPCQEIMPPLIKRLLGSGYSMNDSDPDLKLELFSRYDHIPIEQDTKFLGVISLYGLNYGPSATGFIVKTIFELKNQKAQKVYRIYNERQWNDSDSVTEFVSAIKTDIDSICE